MRRTTRPGAVLFDLDGTLLDTAPDMARALNSLRVAEGLDEMPFSEIRPHVSHGAARLIAIGFDCSAGERFEQLRTRFLGEYSRDVARQTRLFEGLEPVLEAIEELRIAWGIVTNKPGWLTEPLVEAVGLRRRAACVVSGDTLPRRKPHPDPLLHAANALGQAPSACVYVGDAERDVQAGRAAGMRTIVAAFGYLSDNDDPGSWQADIIVDHPGELLQHLGLEDQPAPRP